MRLASAEVATPFLLDVLARDGAAWVRESTDSMAPLVRAGDRLVVVPLDRTRVRVGDLVAYRREQQLVVHRVLRVDAAGLVTKGDALPARDATIGWDAVVGRVAGIAGAGGRPHRDMTVAPWPALGRVMALLSRVGEAAGASAAAPASRRVGWALARLPMHVIAWLTR